MAIGKNQKQERPYIHMVMDSFYLIFFGLPRKNAIGLQRLPQVFCCIALIVGLMRPAKLLAEDTRAQAAEASLLPWQLLGLDSEFSRRNQKALRAMHGALLTSWVDGAQNLDRLLGPEGDKLSLNLQHALHNVMSGKARADLGKAHIVVPILCPVGDSLLVGIEVVELETGLLLGAEQILVPRQSWEEIRRAGQSAAALALPHDEWMASIEARAQAGRGVPSAHKLALRLLRGSESGRTGSHLCYNVLLTQSLLAEQNLPSIIDHLEITRLRNVLVPMKKASRATRTLLIDWGSENPGLNPNALVRFSESVLGSRSAPDAFHLLTIDNAQARMKVTDALITQIKGDRQELLLADRPLVSRIDRAWVYLDKGRAWGLDMDDRVYLQDGPRLIKGHVIGFFGAGLNIKSPRGYAIDEGAIVYIRKGQRDVKVGDGLDFDPTAFPTPWPPVRQPALPKP